MTRRVPRIGERVLLDGRPHQLVAQATFPMHSYVLRADPAAKAERLYREVARDVWDDGAAWDAAAGTWRLTLSPTRWEAA